jgi:hypothetical protein
MTDHPGIKPLPADVIATLEYLLRPDDPIHAALLAQIPHATVQSHCKCGCPTVYFGLNAAAVTPGPVDPARHPIVAEADIVPQHSQSTGQVLVFAYNGYLSWLELCSWAKDPITTWPPPDQLVIPDRSGTDPAR